MAVSTHVIRNRGPQTGLKPRSCQVASLTLVPSVTRILTVTFAPTPVSYSFHIQWEHQLSSARLLLDMQQIDQRLATSAAEFRKLASELQSEGNLKRLRDESEVARVKVLETRLEHGKLDAEVSTQKARIESIETRLYSGAITNLRELTALEEEHNLAKRNLATAEESVGPARLASEHAAAKHEALQIQLIDTEEQWKVTSKELKKRARDVSKVCKGLELERNGASAGVEERDLALYRNLLPR